MQKAEAGLDWEACGSQASTYGATRHRQASSTHSPARSLPACDCILANISQKLSSGRDTRMRALAHIGSIFSGFCNLAPLRQFSPIRQTSFSLFPSHVQASTWVFFRLPMFPGTVPERLFVFQVEVKETCFHFQILWSLVQLQESCTWQNSHASEGGKKAFELSKETQRHKIHFTLYKRS